MNKLLIVRNRLGITQSEVERVTGIDTSTLSLYENGIRTPTVKNAKILGELYGIPWTEFFEENEEL